MMMLITAAMRRLGMRSRMRHRSLLGTVHLRLWSWLRIVLYRSRLYTVFDGSRLYIMLYRPRLHSMLLRLRSVHWPRHLRPAHGSIVMHVFGPRRSVGPRRIPPHMSGIVHMV